MNKERLLRLADVLDNVDPETFNLGSWDCGTTACAVGHAAADPVLNAQGLRLEMSDTGTLQPSYQKWPIGWAAVEAFFELLGIQASYLFYQSSYTSRYDTPAAEVAARIRHFVATGVML